MKATAASADAAISPSAPQYFTTREVAELLRVRERKVYDLAAAGEIPHRKITGKLLFPASDIMRWIDGDKPAGQSRPMVLAGSHDPLLDWAVRESACGLATLLNGSNDGLERFAAGAAALTGMHIPQADGWNLDAVQQLDADNCVLLSLTTRVRGLVVSREQKDAISCFADLSGKRVALRPPGAGAALLLEALLAQHNMEMNELEVLPACVHTEHDAAAAVATGTADAAMAIEAVAEQFKLPFVPLQSESFDLLVDCHSYFSEPVQKLVTFIRGDAFREKAMAMGGYDASEVGRVRWRSAA